MKKIREICKVILPKTNIETELIKIYPRAIDKDTYMERITGVRGGERGYRLYGSEDKTVYPSVTTILHALAKPALPNWYAKKVAEKAGELYWESSGKDIDTDTFIKNVKSAPSESFKRSGLIGTEAHDCIHNIIQAKINNPYSSYEEIGKYVIKDTNFTHEESMNAVNSWLEFTEHPNRKGIFNFLESEFATYHWGDVNYAGTVDAIASTPDKTLMVFDWKTGSDIYDESALQMSAYVNAIWNHDSTGSQLRMLYKRIVGCVVKLGTTEHPDSKVRFVSDWGQTYRTFRSLAEVHKGMQDKGMFTADLGEALDE